MRVAPLALLPFVLACNTAPSATSSAPLPEKGASTTTKLGEPITATPVALSDIAKNPAAWANKTIATSGTVTAVCQQMGCWMELKDDKGEAHVKMHGHSFFVPKTASGRRARLQGVVENTNPDEECTQEAEKQTNKPVAKIALDATGVELD